MPSLNAKTAIVIAKGYVEDVFGDEGAYNIGLEEIVFDPSSSTWDITIGFSRPWDRPTSTFQNAIAPQPERRSYKVVEIDDVTEQVVGVRDRPLKLAS